MKSHTELILASVLEATRSYMQHSEECQADYVERQEESLLALLKHMPIDIEGKVEKTKTGNSFIIIGEYKISSASEYGYYNVTRGSERALLQSWEAIQLFEQFVSIKEKGAAL